MTKVFETASTGESLKRLVRRRPAVGARTVLQDISLDVCPGEAIGIIGRNGAGKSTLLRIAAGITTPSSGHVRTTGTPAPIIELGFAFHPQLTARENLPLAAAILGVERDGFEARRAIIEEFSGVGRFLDLPMKHFSTGMIARLGFSLATHIDAPILLVDEVLAVGDRQFQNQCISHIRGLVQDGCAVLFVSHDLDLVSHVCNRAVRLDDGRITDSGTANEVVARYARAVTIPRSDAWQQGARIESFDIREAAIHSGDSYDLEVGIRIDDPRPLLLQSEFYSPSERAGAVNTDIVPPGVLENVGYWRLRGTLGPVAVTAATAELSVSLIELAGRTDSPEQLVDRRAVPVEVIGEEMGGPKFIADTSWSVTPVDQGADAARRRSTAAASGETVIECVSLTKKFSRAGKRGHKAVAALDNVTLSVARGESIGLIGANGAGKSTLLRCLVRATTPTCGTCKVVGRFVAVLELGLGLKPDLSGRENARFLWLLHGGDRKRFPEALKTIEKTAGIGEVLDMAIKHYSTGMQARLTLALALELEPDVLIVDEALSVGDLEFRERMQRRLRSHKAAGRTLIFASHDLHMVGKICDRVIRLDGGRLVEDEIAERALAAGGGTGWTAASIALGGTLQVHNLQVTPELIGWNEPIEVTFTLNVDEPAPDTYIEFSLRESLDDETRSRPLDPLTISKKTMCIEKLNAVAPALEQPGNYQVRGLIAGIPARNTANVVISAVDAIEGDLISEQWTEVRFGASSEGRLGSRLQIQWSLVSPDDPVS